MVKMSGKEKRQRKKKAKCFADLVEEVPKVITNTKYGTSYEKLHFIGSVSVTSVCSLAVAVIVPCRK